MKIGCRLGGSNMRKIIYLILVAMILIFISGNVTVVAASKIDVDASEAKHGIVKVKFNTGSQKKIKLIIKNGADKYVYNLSNKDEYVNFPLQLGNGNYTASVYENTAGTKYRKLHSESFKVNIVNLNDVYLNSVQEIDWNDERDAILLAKEILGETLENKRLTSNDEAVELTNQERIDALYDYVLINIGYDYDKIKLLKYNYLPDIDETVEVLSGICYDYSSLLAAMLRSQGIPTKLVKGYTNWTSVYHAWNEIYSFEEERWIIVDTTYDSYMYRKKRQYNYEKALNVYQKSKEY